MIVTSRDRQKFALFSQKTLTLTSCKIITACNNSNLICALRIIFLDLLGKYNHKNRDFDLMGTFKYIPKGLGFCHLYRIYPLVRKTFLWSDSTDSDIDHLNTTIDGDCF